MNCSRTVSIDWVVPLNKVPIWQLNVNVGKVKVGVILVSWAVNLTSISVIWLLIKLISVIILQTLWPINWT